MTKCGWGSRRFNWAKPSFISHLSSRGCDALNLYHNRCWNTSYVKMAILSLAHGISQSTVFRLKKVEAFTPDCHGGPPTVVPAPRYVCRSVSPSQAEQPRCRLRAELVSPRARSQPGNRNCPSRSKHQTPRCRRRRAPWLIGASWQFV